MSKSRNLVIYLQQPYRSELDYTGINACRCWAVLIGSRACRYRVWLLMYETMDTATSLPWTRSPLVSVFWIYVAHRLLSNSLSFRINRKFRTCPLVLFTVCDHRHSFVLSTSSTGCFCYQPIHSLTNHQIFEFRPSKLNNEVLYRCYRHRWYGHHCSWSRLPPLS